MSDQDQQPVDEAQQITQAIVERLRAVVPVKLVAEENRQPLADSFVDMLGRLVEFLEQFRPMNQGQMAALLYFVDSLQLDHVGADNSFIMLTMVGAAKKAARELRRGRRN